MIARAVAATAALLVLTAAAAAAPPYLLHAVSGAPQSAWSYAAIDRAAYDAAFTKPLVVRLIGHHASHAVVRFTCISRDCELAPSEQPDSVTRVDPRSYNVKSDDDGTATISVTLQVDTPGTNVVRAAPVIDDKPLPRGTADFILTAR
ncbi:MAG: hypothetical protein ABR975_02370 [Vulcanimicrobiaceae bacterium]